MRALSSLSPLCLTLALTGAFTVAYATPSLARACRCVPKSTKDALAGADAVFSGTVKKVSAGEPGRLYDVEVAGWWKGDPGRAIVVGSSTSSCGVTLKPGATRTFYAKRDGEQFRISLCSGPGGGEEQPLDELTAYNSYDGGAPPPSSEEPVEEIPEEEEAPKGEAPKGEAPKGEAKGPPDEKRATPAEPAADGGAGGCSVNRSAPAGSLPWFAGLGLLLLIRRRG